MESRLRCVCVSFKKESKVCKQTGPQQHGCSHCAALVTQHVTQAEGPLSTLLQTLQPIVLAAHLQQAPVLWGQQGSSPPAAIHVNP